MITQNNIQYRNLEEQVRKNTELLNFIPMGLAGADFLGILDENPDISTNLRKTYLRDTANGKFHLFYIDPIKGIVDLGAFPAEGPQGEPGIAIPSPGPIGSPGIGWLVGSTNFPSTLIDGSPLVDGTLFLNTTTYNIYRYRLSSNRWYGIGNIRGGVGPKGDRGAQGEQGPIGLTGSPGPAGRSGATYAIQGIVSSSEQLTNIPAADGGAYLVGTASPYDLWLVINGRWVDVGPFPFIMPTFSLLNTVYGSSDTDAATQRAIYEALVNVAPATNASTNLLNPYEVVTATLNYTSDIPEVIGTIGADTTNTYETTGFIPLSANTTYYFPKLNEMGYGELLLYPSITSPYSPVSITGAPVGNVPLVSSPSAYQMYRYTIPAEYDGYYCRFTYLKADKEVIMAIKGSEYPTSFIPLLSPIINASSDLTTITVNDNTKYVNR